MNLRRDRWICAGAIALATCAACQFASPTVTTDLCTTAAASCVSDTVLRTCAEDGASEVEIDCAWGCVSSGDAHCGALVPAGGAIAREDLAPADLADLVLSDTTVNTDDGAIDGVRGRDPGVKNGIEFKKSGDASVFRVKSLRISGTVRLRGNRAIAIVAHGAIIIDGLIDGRGDPVCATAGRVAGPGGFDGGDDTATGQGPGGGAGTSAGDSGGGGGGYGSDGGIGGGTTGALGGTAFGTAEITALVGGSGGGGGGSGGNSGTGGGGGAAIQLASSTSIAITATGGVNAGGCGGDRGEGGSDGGGGGGAGGTILLEAPAIAIAGRLAVNGGGGGTRLAFGAHATLDRTPAPGGIAPTVANGNGGAGGAGGMLSGGLPVGGTFGGGGGAVGRMRFHTRTGAVTVDAGAELSPALSDSPTTATQSRARVE